MRKKYLFIMLLILAVLLFAGCDKEEMLDKRAEKGDQNAQQELAWQAYQREDYETAVRWYTRAAEQGNAMAQFNLGIIYINGYGNIERNYAKARDYFLKAAEQQYKGADIYLGYMAFSGLGQTQSYNEAASWFTSAVERGDGYGHYYLGQLYRDGLGVTQDTRKAIQLYQWAAEAGITTAWHSLGSMYSHGKGSLRNPEKAVQAFTKAAEAGIASSQNALGYMYQQGQGVERDYAKSVDWFRKGAAQDDVYAIDGLAGMYTRGWGVEQDFAQARVLYLRAAGLIEARLTKLDAEGDDGYSVKLEKHAQGQVLAFTLGFLGQLYEKGQGGPVDYVEALRLYREAAITYKGAQGQYDLARLYFKGEHVERDYVKAWVLLQKALVNEDTYEYYFDFEKEPLLADIRALLPQVEYNMTPADLARAREALDGARPLSF